MPPADHWKILWLNSLIELIDNQLEVQFDDDEQSLCGEEIQFMIDYIYLRCNN